MSGAETFNYWRKEKPSTTNQVYGFYLRDSLDANGRAKSSVLRPAVPLEARQTIERASSAQMPKEKIKSSRHDSFFTAPSLPADYHSQEFADSGKVLYLWNTLAGCTVRVKL